MKLGAIDHPKTKDFRYRLNQPLPMVLGYLELLWQFTAIHAIQGNIGKWPDTAIAEACMANGIAPEDFIATLVASKLIDRCHTHRLVIHDWKDHAPAWVSAKLKKLGLVFLVATEKPLRADLDATSRDGMGCDGTARDVLSCPPSGEREKPVAETGKPKKVYSAAFERWYALYPRKTGKGKASAAFGRAIGRIAGDRGVTKAEALEVICEATMRFTKSPAGKKGDYVPYPASWLNGSHFDDDPREWEFKANGSSGSEAVCTVPTDEELAEYTP